MMKMDCDFSNLKLSATSNFDMQDPVILGAIAVSVIVDVVARDGNVFDIQCGVF